MVAMLIIIIIIIYNTSGSCFLNEVIDCNEDMLSNLVTYLEDFSFELVTLISTQLFFTGDKINIWMLQYPVIHCSFYIECYIFKPSVFTVSTPKWLSIFYIIALLHITG